MGCKAWHICYQARVHEPFLFAHLHTAYKLGMILALYYGIPKRPGVTVLVGITTLCAWAVAINRSTRAMHYMLRNHLVQLWVLFFVWELS